MRPRNRAERRHPSPAISRDRVSRYRDLAQLLEDVHDNITAAVVKEILLELAALRKQDEQAAADPSDIAADDERLKEDRRRRATELVEELAAIEWHFVKVNR